MSWKLAYKLVHATETLDGMVAMNISDPLTRVEAASDYYIDIQATANVGTAPEVTVETYDILGAYGMLNNAKGDASAQIQLLDASGYSQVTIENLLWTGLRISASANEIAKATLTGYAHMDGASTSTSPITYAAGSGGTCSAVVFYKGITASDGSCLTTAEIEWRADPIIPDPCDNKLYPTDLGRGPARCTVAISGYTYGSMSALENTLDASFAVTLVDIAGAANAEATLTNVRWGLCAYSQQHSQLGLITLAGTGTTVAVA